MVSLCKMWMGPEFLLGIAVVILIGKGSAQNPNGDSIMCYKSFLSGTSSPPVCLGAALKDGILDAKSRVQHAGDVFGGACTKKPEVTWVVKTENGITSLRPKNDQSKCLTFDSNTPIVKLALCSSGNKYQNSSSDNNQNDTYNQYRLWNKATGITLSFDLARHRLKRNGQDTYLHCQNWVWFSQVEKQAEPIRNTAFTFPVKDVDNPLRAQYTAGFIHQIATRTMYPRVVFNQDPLLKNCKKGPASCFPIDYDISAFSSKSVTLNLTLKAGGTGYENTPSKNRVLTGMFAKPGKDVTIELGNFNISKVAIIANLYLHEVPGGNLAKNLLRPAHVALRDGLVPGVNILKNIYGGPLTLEVIGTDPTTPIIKAKISNAVPMATFILGVTKEAEWTKELQKQPSWFIFQGEHAAGLDLKDPYLGASFSQVKTMVQRYDILMKNNFLLSGYDLDAVPRSTHSIPNGWYWWARDSTFDVMYAGNPVELAWYKNDQDMSLNWANFGIWGVAHEFGHVFQTRCFSNLYLTEVTNNVYTVFQVGYFCNDGKFTGMCRSAKTGHNFVNLLAQVKTALASGKTYMDMGLFESLLFWIQLVSHYGYVPHRNMQRRFRERLVDPTDTLCNGDNQAKFDAVYETWSEMIGEDLTKHFVTYRVPISQGAKDRVAAKGYPQPSVDISNIKVLEGSPVTWNPNGEQPGFALPPYNIIEPMP